VALGCGCGITVVGVLEPNLDGGAVDGGSETGASLPEGGMQDALVPHTGDDTTIDILTLDASVDANPVNCAAACDGGVCDGGWCTYSCGAGECQNAPVVCPPGVPCIVACMANGTCAKGVDCTAATACEVRCGGDGSCINDKVRCSGAACTVRCRGNNSCSQGVECDAGTCAIGCTGQGSCANSTIECHSDTCQVVCGDGTGTGTNACNKGVLCVASKACSIACQDQNTCQNEPITAVAGTRAEVRCTGSGSCNKGIVTSAPDSGAFCKNTACGPGISCDGGVCTAHCDGTTVGLCCKADTCNKQSNNCSLPNSCP